MHGATAKREIKSAQVFTYLQTIPDVSDGHIVDIYYSLDGKAPALHTSSSYEHTNTRIYVHPFLLLNTGQNVVKAIAVNR